MSISVAILIIIERDVYVFWVWGTTSVLCIISFSLVTTRKVFFPEKIREGGRLEGFHRGWVFQKKWAEVFRGDSEIERWIIMTSCLLKQLEFLRFWQKLNFFLESFYLKNRWKWIQLTLDCWASFESSSVLISSVNKILSQIES